MYKNRDNFSGIPAAYGHCGEDPDTQATVATNSARAAAVATNCARAAAAAAATPTGATAVLPL